MQSNAPLCNVRMGICLKLLYSVKKVALYILALKEGCTVSRSQTQTISVYYCYLGAFVQMNDDRCKLDF